jgi:alpha-tubulin suppressor-like RCC1 family protein
VGADARDQFGLVNRLVPTQIGSGTGWAAVTAGGRHTCATRTDGTLWCWGRNNLGQLGDGTTTDSPAPSQVGTSYGWVGPSVGYQHTCATRSDASIWCWGWNSSGQLGDTTKATRTSPVRVASPRAFASVAAGYRHTCALSSGLMYCWGWNGAGQLGDRTTTDRLVPVGVQLPMLAARVVTGSDHSCAVDATANSSLWCWGFNGSGQDGDGTTGNLDVPTAVGQHVWVRVSSSNGSTCAIRGDGSLWCWGENIYGKLGDGTTIRRLVPTRIGTFTDWLAVAADASGTCGLRGTGTPWCWGRSADLGQHLTPTQVPSAQNSLRSLEMRNNHACGIDVNRALWCWGVNSSGELGDGTLTDRPAPVRVGTDANWVRVTTGVWHTCGIRTDGSAWCWGNNGNGQLGDLTTVQYRNTPTLVVAYPGPFNDVSAGYHGSCGLRGSTPGLMACWGAVPADFRGDGVTQYAQVHMGEWDHGCARKPNGTLWCWGGNTYGQIGDGTTIARSTPVQVGTATDWVTADMGQVSGCGIRGLGVLYCWGNNDYGQVGDGTTTSRLLPVLIPAMP